VRVHCTAVNRADTLQRQGQYSPPAGASSIIGLECAGEVAQVGADCKQWRVGDRVMALLSGGGYAQYAAVPAEHCMAIPPNLNYEQAAAIPETWLTAFQIMSTVGGVKAGEYVLIHAGASGVGTAAIQLCGLFGANAIVSVGSADKLSFCRKLGAVFGVNYKQGPFAPPILEFLQSRNAAGVDLVLDCVGASNAVANLNVLKPLDSRWVLYGTMGGAEVDRFPLGMILRKRVTLTGSTLRTRAKDYKARLTRAFSEHTLQAFATGALTPVIDRSYTLDEVAAAHTRMEADLNIGKLLLTVRH